MDNLAEQGRNHTIRVFASILLISIWVIGFYHIAKGDFESKKFIQQLARLTLTGALMYFVYTGRNWARIAFSILLGLGVLGALLGMLVPTTIAGKIPFVVMAFIYGRGLYHLNYSETFKAFMDHQNARPS